jgi:hypothetical protein
MITLPDGTVLENIVQTGPDEYEKDDRIEPCPKCDFGSIHTGICSHCMHERSPHYAAINLRAVVGFCEAMLLLADRPEECERHSGMRTVAEAVLRLAGAAK